MKITNLHSDLSKNCFGILPYDILLHKILKPLVEKEFMETLIHNHKFRNRRICGFTEKNIKTFVDCLWKFEDLFHYYMEIPEEEEGEINDEQCNYYTEGLILSFGENKSKNEIIGGLNRFFQEHFKINSPKPITDYIEKNGIPNTIYIDYPMWELTQNNYNWIGYNNLLNNVEDNFVDFYFNKTNWSCGVGEEDLCSFEIINRVHIRFYYIQRDFIEMKYNGFMTPYLEEGGIIYNPPNAPIGNLRITNGEVGKSWVWK
tara:strand:- start:10248 stop:11024 length:777 start_codon:yes stop_codon:yes gene_type:complete